MKILYGVQGTGNGHISRARVMQQALARQGIKVDYLFSGRPADQYFDMTEFGQYRLYQGLTFKTEAGKVDYVKTVQQIAFKQFCVDVQELELAQYDLVLTDFEPITAWAAKANGKPCIGLGNQYAYWFNVPRTAETWLSRQIMRWFAPPRIALGNHWHHFGSPILPPLLETTAAVGPAQPNQVLVYLPFESAPAVFACLMPLQQYQFHFFTNALATGQYGHINVHALSRSHFINLLGQCESVLCNAGFELTSEALQMGKRILLKPLHGQMEQVSNAMALKHLGYGDATTQLSSQIIASWLNTAAIVQVKYPDVASAVVEWLLKERWQEPDELAQQLWSDVQISRRH